MNKVGHIIVYRTDELEDYEEEVEGTVLGGEEFSIVPVVYPHVTVSI